MKEQQENRHLLLNTGILFGQGKKFRNFVPRRRERFSLAGKAKMTGKRDGEIARSGGKRTRSRPREDPRSSCTEKKGMSPCVGGRRCARGFVLLH